MLSDSLYKYNTCNVQIQYVLSYRLTQHWKKNLFRSLKYMQSTHDSKNPAHDYIRATAKIPIM